MPTLRIEKDAPPQLLAAISAQLRQPPEPVDPNHNPFGHVRFSPQGGGWLCGLCGKPVVSIGPAEWKHA